MLGVTNAIEQRTRWNVDEHTLFLLTDTVEDRSINHIHFSNTGVTVSNSITRDNRNSLYFTNTTGLYFVYTNTPIMQMWGRNSWTIEYWIYFHSMTTNGGYGPNLLDIAQNPNGTGNALLLWLHDKTYIYSSKNGTTTWDNYNRVDTKLTPPTDTWVHHAVVLNATNQTITCYMNGIQKHQQSDSASWNAQGGIFGINYRITQSPHTSGFTMNLQDFRISNIARYTANFTPPERFI